MLSKLSNNTLLSKHLMSTSQNLLIQNDALTYTHYQRQLQQNIQLIMKKYPYLDGQKIRNLLQEIDNNKELAIELLDAEQQQCNEIAEESNCEVKKQPMLSQEQENAMLKQSFLNLYRKFVGVSKEIQKITEKNQNLRQQNCKLKQINQMLLEGEYQRNSFEGQTPIY